MFVFCKTSKMFNIKSNDFSLRTGFSSAVTGEIELPAETIEAGM